MLPQSDPPQRDAGRSSSPSHASETPPASAESTGIDRDLLERVLQETLAAVTIGADELASLVSVRRALDRQPFSQAVARDLVEVIVRHRLPGVPLSPVQREAMLQQIAAALVDDPRSEQRLERLWAQLGEAAR